MTTAVRWAARGLASAATPGAFFFTKSLLIRGYASTPRKRTKQVPNRTQERCFWSSPSTSSGEFNIAHGCSLLNRREYNEDRFVITHLTPELSYFGVFDGHGGDQASEFAAEFLHEMIKKQLDAGKSYEEGLREGFLQLDSEFCNIPELPKCGTTATVGLMADKRLVVAHVGDSRAVILHKGTPTVLTTDHKPNVPEERQRIEGCGGEVTTDPNGTTTRVNGRLAMSRAIGDPELKRFGVTAEPQIVDYNLTNEDVFLVLATDGVYDVLSNEQVCAVANTCQDPTEASQELVSLSSQLGSSDNATAIVVRLGGWGKFPNQTDTARLRNQTHTYHRGGRFRPLSLIF
eukprot:comp17977_c0_seq1/m.18360 comp17977_c0_seq1/g.18360  ORF comp17977_c0_seq1/g.18360 comp17977_c0_seq1/m.18360 type:complete len:346 (-) comp17977_c0_seq1:189-1226(-)